jgi:hypothetical protein
MQSFIKTILIGLFITVALNTYAQSDKKTQGQSKEDSTIQQITIKYSGFLEDDEFTIRFTKDQYNIVEVLNRGRSVPSDSFYKYEPLLYDYLQYRGLSGIVPRLSRLKRDLRRGKRVDSTHIREAIRLQRNLDSLKLRIAIPYKRIETRIREGLRIKREAMDSLRQRIDRDDLRIARRISEEMRRTQRELVDVRSRLEQRVHRAQRDRDLIRMKIDLFLEALIQESILNSKEDVITINKKGKCWINDKLLSPEDTEKVKELWNKHMDQPFEESDRTIKL